ncbi:MAG: hypothetical protein V1904_00985 [Bacteroidota bacterium]
MKKIILFITVTLFVILSSCWDETDTITFYKDGTIKFVSVVTVSDSIYKSSDIEIWIKSYVDELTKANWNVKWEWKNKKLPFEIKLTGNGNIHKISKNTNFYIFEEISDNKYIWQFTKPQPLGEGKRRMINISKESVKLLTTDKKVVNSIIADTAFKKYILDLN